MREVLKQMYIDIHGGVEQVNLFWLDIHNDDEIIAMLTAAGRLGVSVDKLTRDYSGELLRATVPAIRRDKETGRANDLIMELVED